MEPLRGCGSCYVGRQGRWRWRCLSVCLSVCLSREGRGPCLGGQATRHLGLCIVCEETTHRIANDSTPPPPPPPGGRGLRPGRQLLDNNAVQRVAVWAAGLGRVIVVNTLSPPIVSHSLVHAWYAGRRMSSARNETLDGCGPIMPVPVAG